MNCGACTDIHCIITTAWQAQNSSAYFDTNWSKLQGSNRCAEHIIVGEHHNYMLLYYIITWVSHA